MMGYGPEDKNADLELTYNYGVKEYDKGNGCAQIAIGTDDVHKKTEAIAPYGGKITSELGLLPGINTKVTACVDPNGWKSFTNMNSMRNLFIVGVSIFLGLSIPQYFFAFTMRAQHGPAHTRSGWFNDLLNTLFSSPAMVAFIVGVFLDNTFEFKDTARDREMPWWARFRTFKGDSRNEEFYTLPFNLNRFFPLS